MRRTLALQLFHVPSHGPGVPERPGNTSREFGARRISQATRPALEPGQRLEDNVEEAFG